MVSERSGEGTCVKGWMNKGCIWKVLEVHLLSHTIRIIFEGSSRSRILLSMLFTPLWSSILFPFLLILTIPFIVFGRTVSSLLTTVQHL